jgi:hypothetical protein
MITPQSFLQATFAEEESLVSKDRSPGDHEHLL